MKKYVVLLLFLFVCRVYAAELQVNKITASESISGPSGAVAYSNEVLTTYETYSSTISQDAGGTCTIAYAHGSLVRIMASTNLTITFDNTDYPTNGVNRVGVELFASTNAVSFISATISNATTPTISTTDWTSLFFRKSNTNTVWIGRQ